CDTEERNEADGRADTERHPPDGEREDATNGCERYVQVDEPRWAHRSVDHEQQKKDEEERGGDGDRKPLGGLLQVLELTAPLDKVPRRHFDLRVDALLRLGYELCEIIPTHIGHDGHSTLDVLASDLSRPVFQGEHC